MNAFTVVLVVLFAQQQQGYQGAVEKLPQAVAPQPIPFSHKQHATAAALACLDCHAGVKLPATAKCMACHRTIKAESPAIAKLAAAHEAKEKIPWVRVYRVKDFVFFSHQSHEKAACDTCHGPVAERDVLAKEKGTNMATCVACHKAQNAPLECNLCHQLGQ